MTKTREQAAGVRFLKLCTFVDTPIKTAHPAETTGPQPHHNSTCITLAIPSAAVSTTRKQDAQGSTFTPDNIKHAMHDAAIVPTAKHSPTNPHPPKRCWCGCARRAHHAAAPLVCAQCPYFVLFYFPHRSPRPNATHVYVIRVLFFTGADRPAGWRRGKGLSFWAAHRKRSAFSCHIGLAGCVFVWWGRRGTMI